jgi:hypothetical protein
MSNLWVEVEELGTYSSSEYAYDAVKTASYMLWAMSGRKFTGTTTVTEKYVCPIRGYRSAADRRFNFLPSLVNGEVINFANGTDLDSVDGFFYNENSTRTRIRLRGRRVIKVHAMRTQSGAVVPPSQYYLVDHSSIQTNTNGTWSTCNVEVTYTYGTPVPFAGKMAAKLLAIELVKMYEGDPECALPQRVTSVNRQGVSYTILDSQDFIEEGRTGIYAIDLFLKSANPDRAKARAKVFSPDLARGRRNNSREKLLPESVYDFVVSTTGGTLDIPFSVIDADSVFSQEGWTYSVVVSNWDSTRTTTLAEAPDVSLFESLVRSVSNKALTSNVATLTTTSAHGLVVGNRVTISGVGSPFNGTHTVTSVPTSTTFTFAVAGSNVASTAVSPAGEMVRDDDVTLTAAYTEVMQTLGYRDPGLYTIYATRPDQANPEIDEIIPLYEGNIYIQLASPVTPIYSP